MTLACFGRPIKKDNLELSGQAVAIKILSGICESLFDSCLKTRVLMVRRSLALEHKRGEKGSSQNSRDPLGLKA